MLSSLIRYQTMYPPFSMYQSFCTRFHQLRMSFFTLPKSFIIYAKDDLVIHSIQLNSDFSVNDKRVSSL